MTMMTKRIWAGGLTSLLTLWGTLALAQPVVPPPPTSQPTMEASPADLDWAHILTTYVDEQGRVDYAGLAANAEDKAKLDAYVAGLATADPSGLSREGRRAWWINAFNALVVKTIVDRWPVGSITEIDGFFDSVRHNVAGQSLTLNELTDQNLRNIESGDPRIHFAIAWGANGNAPLRREPYVEANLDEQLEEQTRNYIQATTSVDAEERQIHVSKIFEWYAPDFEFHGAIRGFVARYAHSSDSGAIRATRNFFHFDDFDWSVNVQPSGQPSEAPSDQPGEQPSEQPSEQPKKRASERDHA